VLLSDEKGLGRVEESTKRLLVSMERVLNKLQYWRCYHNCKVITV